MRRRPFLLVLLLALTGIVIQGGRELALRLSRHPEGPVIHETTSAYSRIRVRERDGIRRLFFVDPQGRERQQSAVDLREPERLQLAYSQSMFLSFTKRFWPGRMRWREVVIWPRSRSGTWHACSGLRDEPTVVRGRAFLGSPPPLAAGIVFGR